jgi:hypothetical protein
VVVVAFVVVGLVAGDFEEEVLEVEAVVFVLEASDLQDDLSVVQEHVGLSPELLAVEVIIDLIIVDTGVDTIVHGIDDGGTGIGGGDILIVLGTVLQSTGEVDSYLQLSLY